MKTKRLLFTLIVSAFILTASSCRSYVPAYDYRRLAQAGLKLGIDIDFEDNHDLYLESAKWLGVPYRYGGQSMRGTDCSGFTQHIYKKVYGKTISRSSADQREDCDKVKKRKLKEGDLVLFSKDGRGRSRINHVGIYLKDGKFVHASTTKGVTVDKLKDKYYSKRWKCGGRVR